MTVLGEALKDRFVWIKLDYQSPEEEIQIIKQEVGLNDDDSGERIARISQQINQATRNTTSLRRGSSIRGAIDLAALMSKEAKNESSKNWVNNAIMALYNKIELEDGINKTKAEIITDIVLAILSKSDFQ